MKLLAVTINPCDKYQYFNKPDRLNLFRTYVADLLQSWPGLLWAVPEASFPTFAVQGCRPSRLHLHGLWGFKPKHLKIFLLEKYYSLSRTTSVHFQELSDINLWIKYCEKQDYLMGPAMGNISLEDLLLDSKATIAL